MKYFDGERSGCAVAYRADEGKVVPITAPEAADQVLKAGDQLPGIY